MLVEPLVIEIFFKKK